MLDVTIKQDYILIILIKAVIEKMISLNRSHNHVLISLGNHKRIININYTKYPIIREISLHMDFQISQELYNILWTDHALTIKQIRVEQPTTRINHIPEITQITRKNKMATHLNTLKNYFPKEYNFYPQTWLLPVDHQRLLKKHVRGKFYICKPENGCQGQGIYLIDNPHKLERENNEVIQQYITNPYLIDGLKFDLRIYVLITCVNPLRVYLYNDGIVRFATQKFQPPNQDNLQNYFSHLTNYAINKANTNFKVDDDNQNEGHKRLISSVFKGEEYGWLMHKASKIIIKTIISGLPWMQNGVVQCKKNDPSSCFQLLGFDIILNHRKQPILLEVNQNPSLVTDTQLDHTLKSRLVKNIFEMVTTMPPMMGEQKFQTKVKMKDRHETAFKGNFNKIYPCSSLEETEEYDEFIIRSNSIYKDKFGINLGRSTRRMHQTSKIEEQQMLWNEQPNHYTKDKVEKVYRARLIKTSNYSNHKKRLVLI